MGLTPHLGALAQCWVARCWECKREVITPAVTRGGARHVLEASQWTEGPRGWLCSQCRTVNNKR